MEQRIDFTDHLINHARRDFDQPEESALKMLRLIGVQE